MTSSETFLNFCAFSGCGWIKERSQSGGGYSIWICRNSNKVTTIRALRTHLPGEEDEEEDPHGDFYQFAAIINPNKMFFLAKRGAQQPLPSWTLRVDCPSFAYRGTHFNLVVMPLITAKSRLIFYFHIISPDLIIVISRSTITSIWCWRKVIKEKDSLCHYYNTNLNPNWNRTRKSSGSRFL